jgi:predicted XRE-type DNA-binding protein
MSKKRFANVWDAIEDTPAQAENMKLRSALMMALKDHIARTGLSQSEAAKLLGVPQPRISDLKRGKVELFGLDTLVNSGPPVCMLKCASRMQPDQEAGPLPVVRSDLLTAIDLTQFILSPLPSGEVGVSPADSRARSLSAGRPRRWPALAEIRANKKKHGSPHTETPSAAKSANGGHRPEHAHCACRDGRVIRRSPTWRGCAVGRRQSPGQARCGTRGAVMATRTRAVPPTPAYLAGPALPTPLAPPMRLLFDP